MIVDLSDLPDGTSMQADVAIVGSGPAGISLVAELGLSELSLILVEGGGFDREVASDALNEAESLGVEHKERQAGRARVFGGAAKLWYGQCLRLDEVDHEFRAWVPFSGWPITAEELKPFYERAESFFRIDGQSYDVHVYDEFGIEAPRWNKAELLSMATAYTPDVDTGALWKSRLLQMTSLRILIHSNVTNIVKNERNAFSHLEVRALNGVRATITAGVAVLCAGGLENARLLLLSRSQETDGLGNRHGNVGRFFQEHPNGFSADVIADDSTSQVLQQKFRLLYGKNGVRHFPKVRLAPEVQLKEETLNCSASLFFEYPKNSGIAALQELYRAARDKRRPQAIGKNIVSLVRGAPEVAHAVTARLRSGISPAGQPSRIRLQCYLEQAPNSESRLVLSDRRDLLGLPQLAVDWRLSALELKTLRILTETVRKEFLRLGLGTVKPAEWLISGNGWQSQLADCAHHCGSTRMSKNPETGVVDPDCQVFGVNGLYVAGSSVFPTGGYANPTLSIVALAIRLADHLKSHMLIRNR